MTDKPTRPTPLSGLKLPGMTSSEVVKKQPKAIDSRVIKCTGPVWRGLATGFAVTAGASLIATLVVPTTFAATVLLVSGVGLSILIVGAGMEKLSPHLPVAFQNIANHIYANVADLFALAGVILLTPAAFVNFDPKGKTDAAQTPILLVHGYLHNKSAWLYLRHRLKKAGLGPIYTINLGSPLNSIEEYSKRVKLKAQEIAEQTGRKDLILIGHSMGGLISSYYATHDAPPNTVKDVITMGSPLQGTKMAPLGLGCQCAKQMRYGCEFLGNLKNKVDVCSQTRFFNLGSEADRIVYPQKSALYSHGKAKQVVIPNMGHLRYIFSDEVADLVIDYLKGPELPV